MAQWNPTRRELIKAAPLILGTAALPPKLWAAPAENQVRFFVIGDWGRKGGDYQRWVAAAMNAHRPPRFVLTTGDNFYGAGVASIADEHWRRSFHDIYHPEQRDALWYAALGNHDWGGSIQAQIDRSCSDPRWRLPDHSYKLGASEHGVTGLEIFVVDTTLWIGKESFPHNWRGDDITPIEQQRQKAWLERELKASANVPMKLVLGHHPIYSVGAHGGKYELQDMDDLLRRTGVAAYICGHDHGMYHITHAGMHYICSGAGSEVLPDYTGGPVAGCVLRRSCGKLGEPVWHSFLGTSWRPEYALKGGFAVFEASASGATFSFIDGLGKVRYGPHVVPPRQAAMAAAGTASRDRVA